MSGVLVDEPWTRLWTEIPGIWLWVWVFILFIVVGFMVLIMPITCCVVAFVPVAVVVVVTGECERETDWLSKWVVLVLAWLKLSFKLFPHTDFWSDSITLLGREEVVDEVVEGRCHAFEGMREGWMLGVWERETSCDCIIVFLFSPLLISLQ